MGTRKVLLVVLDDEHPGELRRAVGRQLDGSPQVHVVAPARVGMLDWLATDEDDARTEAEVRAFEAEWTLADRADVEGEAGDADPIVAVEDALHAFDADQILLVGAAAEDGGLEEGLRRFGVPVSRLDSGGRSRRRSALREFRRGITSGRSNATPFVLFAGVNLTLLLLAALVSLIVVLIIWLL
jgi:hypothetical protein